MKLKSLLPSRPQVAVTDPFTSLQREVDRLFSDFSAKVPMTNGVDLVPSIDVSETDKEIEVTAELPGLEEKDVEIKVTDNVLTIRGEKKAEKEQKDKNYHVVERSYGSFARSMDLPTGVNPDSIKANLAKGVLKVTVPKPEPAQSKKIDVKATA
jgi:HSP20 family protein